MKYHITITNNETGETLVDQDTGCIIGACDDRTTCGTRVVSYGACTKLECIATVVGALEAGERHLRKMPRKDQRFLRKLAREEARKNA